jgi:NAD+ kinase
MALRSSQAPAAKGVVLLFSKPRKAEVATLAPELAQWLMRHGYEVHVDDSTADLVTIPGVERLGPDAHTAQRLVETRPAPLAIVLGGDGTLLRVAREMAGTGVPILGVNLGTLGFLTEVTIPELYANLEAIFAGRCLTDRRTMVSAEVIRNGVSLAHFDALNDAVIAKGSLARIIEYEVTIDGDQVAAFRADGVIVSTPTGSTAYSLSAGGPILHPALDALILAPICPHTLTVRPLIVRDSSVIEITLRGEQASLTLDGQTAQQLEPGDTVQCRRGPYQVDLIRLHPRSFFDILRGKLRWG